MADAEALYRREEGSTNFRKVRNPSSIPSEEWRLNTDGSFLVWLRGPEESMSEELSGPEVNELAGRVVVDEPAASGRRSMLNCGCVNPNLCDHGKALPPSSQSEISPMPVPPWT